MMVWKVFWCCTTTLVALTTGFTTTTSPAVVCRSVLSFSYASSIRTAASTCISTSTALGATQPIRRSNINIPSLYDWQILPDGRLEGYVWDHPDLEDGSKISTSAVQSQKPQSDDTILAETESGSQYRLVLPLDDDEQEDGEQMPPRYHRQDFEEDVRDGPYSRPRPRTSSRTKMGPSRQRSSYGDGPSYGRRSAYRMESPPGSISSGSRRDRRYPRSSSTENNMSSVNRARVQGRSLRRYDGGEIWDGMSRPRPRVFDVDDVDVELEQNPVIENEEDYFINPEGRGTRSLEGFRRRSTYPGEQDQYGPYGEYDESGYYPDELDFNDMPRGRRPYRRYEDADGMWQGPGVGPRGTRTPRRHRPDGEGPPGGMPRRGSSTNAKWDSNPGDLKNSSYRGRQVFPGH